VSGSRSFFESTLTRLVDACLAGDETAWTELVAMISPVIMATCSRMRLTQEASLDVFGQVCYLLLKNLDRIRSPERLLGYVATMTRREVLAFNRHRGQFVRLEGEDLETRSIEEPDFDRLLEREDDRALLAAVMLKLPEKEYHLIQMLFFDPEEPSYEEISEKLEMPVASIGPTRQRILAKLLRWLKQRGYKF